MPSALVTDDDRTIPRSAIDERIAAAVAAVGGLGAAAAGAHPTGRPIIDAILVFCAVGVAVWAAASAPWWALTGVAGVAVVISLDPVVGVLAFAAFVGGLYIGVRQLESGLLHGLVAAVALNAMIRSGLGGFLGLSAIIGIACGVLLFATGLRQRSSHTRRIAWMALGSLGLGAVVALGSAALAAFGVRPQLSSAADDARAALAAVNEGDYQGAATLFGDSSRVFDDAADSLDGVVAWPARLLPGVAQNLAAGRDLSAAASQATAEAAAALREVDPASLRVVDGRIDVDAIRAVEAPLVRVSGAFGELRATTRSAVSPWLLGPVQRELDELDTEFEEQQPLLDDAIDAVRLAPALLGGDELRRYLVLFTTPVEARGIAGFIGNYAEVSLDDGAIEVTAFGRRSELDDAAMAERADCGNLPSELLERYGRFGLTSGPDGTADQNVWQNLTMPAHFPYVGEAATCLYPQSGGRPINGVISVDPYVVQALMEYTGPIEVAELGASVTAANAAKFILEDQYVLAGDGATDDRVDALQTLGEGVIERLLIGALPEPSQLARDLGPLVEEHRLMMWTDDADEQRLFAATGLLGAMPALVQDGGFSVIVANSGESKIDVFLDRRTDVRVLTDADGRRTLVANVTLRNNAPSGGLPQYVIGNGYGLPAGTSRLIVNFFGPPSLMSVEQDGAAVAVQSLPEAGWMGYATEVVIGPGDTARYQVRFDLGAASAGGDPVDWGIGGEPVEWVQPLVSRDP